MGQKKFDKAFKEQAVLRILSGESTASETAKEIGVHYTTVRDWVKNYKQDGISAFPGSGNLKPEDEELRKLRSSWLILRKRMKS